MCGACFEKPELGAAGPGERGSGGGRGSSAPPVNRCTCRTCPRAPGAGTALRALRAGFSAFAYAGRVLLGAIHARFPRPPSFNQKTIKPTKKKEVVVRGRPRTASFLLRRVGARRLKLHD